MTIPFDPEIWQTWPIPAAHVSTRWEDGRPRRVSPEGDAWLAGFELALDMANAFHETGQWPT